MFFWCINKKLSQKCIILFLCYNFMYIIFHFFTNAAQTSRKRFTHKFVKLVPTTEYINEQRKLDLQMAKHFGVL